MKKITKYQVLKWFVLFTAILAVLAFLLPFSNPTEYRNNDSFNGHLFENPLTSNGTPLGFEFVFGKAMFSNPTLTAAIWLSRVSFVVALAAVVVAALPLVLKGVNGFNKKGKFHIELIIAPALALLSALINFITFKVGSTKVYQGVDSGYGSSYTYEYHVFLKTYTYIALIVIAVLLILIAILAVKAKADMLKAKNAPATENEETGEVAEVKINKPAAPPKTTGKTGLFSKFFGESAKGNTTGQTATAPQTAADNPANKPLEWFTSEAGLEAFKTYTSAQNYILEENLRKEKEQKYSDWNFDEFLIICHKGVKLPCQYFEALIANIDAEPLKYVGPHDILIGMLKTISQPYSIDEDGEPVPCELAMPPEKILSVEKNPLLYFVKNFDVFKMKDDELGALKDKIALYRQILFFVSVNMYSLVIEDNKWLFDKSTYINDLGIVRKEKAFLKKCKELSGFPEYFDEELAKLG